MKNASRSYRKFQPQQKRIEELEKNNMRFRRIFSEYEVMTDEIWDLESNETEVCDDFINAMKVQTSFLEDEIQDWLKKDEKKS